MSKIKLPKMFQRTYTHKILTYVRIINIDVTFQEPKLGEDAVNHFTLPTAPSPTSTPYFALYHQPLIPLQSSFTPSSPSFQLVFPIIILHHSPSSSSWPVAPLYPSPQPVQCTVYIIYCTMYSVHYILCAVYTIYCIELF